MNAEKTLNPNRQLHRKLARRRNIRGSWPLLVWLGVVGLAFWAYRTGGEFHKMRGVVTKRVETVSAPFTGALVPIPSEMNPAENGPAGEFPKFVGRSVEKLEQGLHVEAGEVVAKLDDTTLKLKIDAEEARAMHREHELGKEVTDLDIMIYGFENDEKRLESDIESKRDLLRLTKESNERGVATDLQVREAEDAVDRRQAALDSVKRNTQDMKRMHANSMERNQDLAERANAEVSLLEDKIEQSWIRPTNAGQIDRIYARPGDMVKAGDPVMDIVIQAPKTITALIPERHALQLKKGDTVYVAIPNNPKNFVTATVLSLQPALTHLPDNTSVIRGRRVRGRLVEFGHLGGSGEDDPLPLLPGSEVIVTLDPPGRIPFLPWLRK